MLSIGITAYAATYRASDITYTNSRNVANALDDLYSKTTELNTIKANINQTNATANDILSGKTAYTGNGLITGSYIPITSTKGTEWYEDDFIVNTGTISINLNFQPRKLFIYVTNPNNINYYELFYIDNNTNRVMWYAQNSSGQENCSSYLYLTSNGFEYVVTSGSIDVGWQAHYIAIK